MRVAQFDAFGSPLYVGERDMPVARPHGVVIKVEATGLCRSDWHGWQGHDSDITELPHVPGHEFAGVDAQRHVLAMENLMGWEIWRGKLNDGYIHRGVAAMLGEYVANLAYSTSVFALAGRQNTSSFRCRSRPIDMSSRRA